MTRWAFRHRAVAWLLTALGVALGVAALFALPRREDPDLQGRFGQVVALYPGATTEQTEAQVAQKLERTLRGIDDIRSVETTVRPGVAVLEFDAADRMTGSLARLQDDVRERIADARAALPAGVRSVVVNDRFSDTAALILGVTHPGAAPRELEAIARRVRDRLEALPEVGEATLLGVREERVTVALSAQRLAQYGGEVTVDRIRTALERRNILPEAGGSVAAGSARLTLAPSGELHTQASIEGIIVGQVDGAPVYLRDLATVTRGYQDPPDSMLRVDGQPAVGVSLTMRRGGNIGILGQRARAALHVALPAGTKLTVLNDLPRSVARRIAGFFRELQWAVAILFGTMWLFMGRRAALLVGAMLPLTMLATFAAMWAAGRDIQQMSIAALIISLALVVDNSVVILDNIEEKLRAGVPRDDACVDGAEEIRSPLLTANLVGMTSFLPLAFLPGSVGDFVRDLGLVTALALTTSALLSLTVLPLLCHRFLKAAGEEGQTVIQRWLEGRVGQLREGKAALAGWAFRRPGTVAGVAALALTGAVSLIPQLGIAFFPPAERDQFVIDIWLPEGRDLAATAAVTRRVEELLAAEKEVVSSVAFLGAGGPRFYYNVSPEPPAANYAQVLVNTRSLDATDRLVPALQARASAQIPAARVMVKKLEQGPPVGAPIALRIAGDDLSTLLRLGEEVKERLAATPGAISVHDSFGAPWLRLAVEVDPERAAAAGVSSATVAETTRLAFSGQMATGLREGDKEIPVDLRLSADERRRPADVLDLYLPSPDGPVQLRDIASLRLEPALSRIVRRDARRTLTVFAYSDGSRLPSAILEELRATRPQRLLPPGYTLAFAGESEEGGKSFTDLAAVFSVALAINLALLTFQFGNAAIVLAVLSSVPLGVIGAVPGLYLARQPFGFMAFLGVAALGGIVTNHTVFLFHYAQEESRLRGVSMTEALVRASRRRLRPILLTVLLSVGALLPQAFSGSRLWPPLDWAIVAGLLVSTFLSMIVIPSVYTLLSRRSGEPHSE